MDASRYYVAVAGPKSQDTDFTWSEFIRRNNDELVANWATSVNRSISFAARNIGEIPAPGQLNETDLGILERSRNAFGQIGESLSRSRFKAGISETMRTLSEANKYLSDEAPWKLRESDPERMNDDLPRGAAARGRRKTLLTPFLPKSSQKVFAMLGGRELGRTSRGSTR